MAAAAMAASSALSPAESFAGLLQRPVEMPPDDVIRALMMDAIGAAKSAGASYSDVRIGRYRNSIVFTREQQIVQTADTDSVGAGVRALVDGTWGFGATKILTRDGVTAAAREAVAIAKANRIARDQPVQLAPVQAYPRLGLAGRTWHHRNQGSYERAPPSNPCRSSRFPPFLLCVSLRSLR